MTREALLIQGAAEFEIALSPDMVSAFMAYKRLLLKWNESVNLTAITEPDEIILKHFLDSLSLFKTNLVFPGARLIDVGTGAGFPAVPLKIALPSLEITLLDSLRKRLSFLGALTGELKANAELLHARAEDAGRESAHRERFDIACARAVAPLSVLAELCLSFVRVGGFFLAMKGRDISREIDEGAFAVKTMGGRINDVLNIDIPFGGPKHSIIIIEKVLPTPSKYPRKAGKPSKDPLI